MKRIKAACIEQTIHFQLKEDLGHAAAVHAVKDELEHYKTQLNRSRTKYKIVEEIAQPDDSIIIKIKKQYTGHNCGDWAAVIFKYNGLKTLLAVYLQTLVCNFPMALLWQVFFAGPFVRWLFRTIFKKQLAENCKSCEQEAAV